MRERESSGPDEDAALMMKVRDGDLGAFARLYDRNARSIVSFAYRFVKDRARAEELAQEIFLKVHRGAPGYEPKARFKTFLFRIASNHCLNEVRRGEVPTETLSPVGDDHRPFDPAASAAESPSEALEGRELERAVGVALAGLPARERAAFVMCRFEGMAYREIAQALDATEPAVKSLIHRATVAVARLLTPILGTDPLEARKRSAP